MQALLALSDETHLPQSKIKRGLVEYDGLQAVREPRISLRECVSIMSIFLCEMLFGPRLARDLGSHGPSV